MFKKVLAGFIVMALALTGMPVTSGAAVDVGDNLKLFGDFRMRFEFDDRSPATTGSGGCATDCDNRERPRIRLRFGAKYQTAIEPLSFGFRLSTESDNLNSPHQNLGLSTLTDNADFGLDRAYAKLKFLESGKLIVGKFGHPFWQQTEQFWDGDIQPEGYAASYIASLGDAGSVTGTVAYYYLMNTGWQNGYFDNDTATTWQALWKGNFQDLGLTVAGTGMHMNDGDNSGNYTVNGLTGDPAFYMVSGQIKGAFDNVKWRVGGDYHLSDVDVVGVSDDHDQGFVIHGRVNIDQWGFRYYYHDIEEFSVPIYSSNTAGGYVYLSQDNFPSACCGAPVGYEGHRIQLDYKFAKGVSADFRIYLMNSKKDNYAGGPGDTTDVNRYQLNFNTKF